MAGPDVRGSRRGRPSPGARGPRWLDARQEHAWRSLQFMQARLSSALARDLVETTGLSYQDYVILVALTDRGDGRMRQYELAEQLGWERSRLSHHLSRMVTRGLVARERAGSDRRGAFAVVTEAGRREIEAAAPSHVAAVRRLFVDRLSPAQLGALSDATDTILGALVDGAVRRGPGATLQPAKEVAGDRRGRGAPLRP